ncbi:hypothetical protein D3C77_680440 [compost metagenome]
MKRLEPDVSCIQQYREQKGKANLADNAQHCKVNVVEKRLNEYLVLGQRYKIIQTDKTLLHPARPIKEPVIEC